MIFRSNDAEGRNGLAAVELFCADLIFTLEGDYSIDKTLLGKYIQNSACATGTIDD